jgi:hypothetical protein
MRRYAVIIAALILLSAALVYGVHPNTARYEALASFSQAPQLMPEEPVGSGFTYQGQLKKDGTPTNATCDFTFSLWDAAGSGSPPSGGNPIGGDQTINDVSVANGLFTLTLNAAGEFGADAFNGEARWLQISVICPGDNEASTLSPRQAITPAPYALSAPTKLYANVVIVAKSGGDFSSIQAALDSIGDAGPGNPYLVWVAPGVYTERVTMKAYVDIEGSGQQVTRITFSGGGANDSATLITASNAALRSLTVENTGGAAYAIAIHNNGSAPQLTEITAMASGDGNIGAAVFNTSSASPSIDNSTLITSGTGFSHYTLYSIGSSTPTVRNSTITAIDGSAVNYGILGAVNSTTTLYNSIVRGTTYAVYMLNAFGNIATSLVDGGVFLDGSGSLACVGAYDQSFLALNGTCQ